MRTFDVNVYFTGTTTITVQADNPDEAKAKAKQAWADGNHGDYELNARDGVEVEMA